MGVVCSSVATVAKHYGMILNYFNNKKQINSKLTQHGGVGDGKRWCINNNFIINKMPRRERVSVG